MSEEKAGLVAGVCETKEFRALRWEEGILCGPVIEALRQEQHVSFLAIYTREYTLSSDKSRECRRGFFAVVDNLTYLPLLVAAHA